MVCLIYFPISHWHHPSTWVGTGSYTAHIIDNERKRSQDRMFWTIPRIISRIQGRTHGDWRTCSSGWLSTFWSACSKYETLPNIEWFLCQLEWFQRIYQGDGSSNMISLVAQLTMFTLILACVLWWFSLSMVGMKRLNVGVEFLPPIELSKPFSDISSGYTKAPMTVRLHSHCHE